MNPASKTSEYESEETKQTTSTEDTTPVTTTSSVSNTDASILQRVISDKSGNPAYVFANKLGSKYGIFLHGLVDFDGLDNVDNVSQFSGKKSGFTTSDTNSPVKNYKIIYTGLDNNIAKQACNNVLQQKRFKNGAKDYKILLNDCNDYTASVMKEYEKLWKQQYAANMRTMNDYQVNAAWRNHKKTISVRKGEQIEINTSK